MVVPFFHSGMDCRHAKRAYFRLMQAISPENCGPDRDPVVVPFFHSGMGRVLPKTKIIPRWGNDIAVTVGSPVDLREQLATCRSSQDKATRQQVRPAQQQLGLDLEQPRIRAW